MEEDKLVLSLPPFNHFGLDSFIKSNNIDYLELEDAVINLIRSACNTISISSSFLEINTVPEIKGELLNKANHTKIRILVRQVNDENTSRKENIEAFIMEAKRRGVLKNIEIRDYHYSEKPPVLSSVHAKFIIVDGFRMYLGSGEIRRNSIEKNFEAGIIKTGNIAKDLEKIFMEIFSKAKPIK
jgi:phosphatidylserine/phosphatidylglycerophosphate/cardiolipin synthase-like enzyme